ncbi:hypothetical protein CAC42_2320 [Sphaceloma murrayae]|uniref:Phosphoglycerate mutase family protein n=1 Tax=Sphaceloma murrayae TaxID=2082308 RepID=A0A2K1QJG5_9PEZI|nr:hypothetical protein CAC42_2320 [Sphaceloma murrayae]
MSKQPAVIIIARHGARLDAADKSWHLTSPTPYDPPLTYGGWTQSRALGLRIASLLHTREESASGDIPTEPHELTTSNGASDSVAPEVKPPVRKRKHKVFIHSSPFQRCVQTGIGISAGLSQYEGIVAGRSRSDSLSRTSRDFQPSPRLHAVDATAASVQARSNLLKSLKETPKQAKATLRIDAYLGEWLSPDYFDLITPPPNSTMMVAGAKADLLRRGEDLDSYSYSHSPTLAPPTKASQGNLWSSRGPEPTSTPHAADGPLDMKTLTQALPGRDRTSSYSSGRVSPFGRPVIQRSVSSERLGQVGYTPPAPNYAISPVEPIPRGYVAHARDACIGIDYQWDSMRAPLEWGDGGQYGEEWSAMHKRFRKGLNHLIEWYGAHGSNSLPDEHEAVPGVDDDQDDHDADEEIVVVLVTHGAGCNALIGALTEQPVLLDVGMASMTMAVRKEDDIGRVDQHEAQMPPIATPTASPQVDQKMRRNASISTGLSQKYDMKIVASSEHLRPGIDPTRPATPTPSSPGLAASKTIPESRRRSTLLSHAAAGSPLEPNWTVSEHGPRPHNMSAALGSIRRLSTQTQNIAAPQRSGSVSSATSATGLWTPSTPPLAEHRNDKDTSPDKKLSPEHDPLDLSGTGLENKLGISYVPDTRLGVPLTPTRSKTEDPTTVPRISMTSDTPSREMRDSVSELPGASPQMPSNIGRKLSQKGLWGSAPSGNYERDRTPKRRWTLQQE